MFMVLSYELNTFFIPPCYQKWNYYLLPTSTSELSMTHLKSESTVYWMKQKENTVEIDSKKKYWPT